MRNLDEPAEIAVRGAGRPVEWFEDASLRRHAEPLSLLDDAIVTRPHWARFRFKRDGQWLARNDPAGAAADFVAAFDLERWTLGSADLTAFRALSRTLAEHAPGALRPDILEFLACEGWDARLGWARSARTLDARLKRLLDAALEDERPGGRYDGDAEILV